MLASSIDATSNTCAMRFTFRFLQYEARIFPPLSFSISIFFPFFNISTCRINLASSRSAFEFKYHSSVNSLFIRELPHVIRHVLRAGYRGITRAIRTIIISSSRSVIAGHERKADCVDVYEDTCTRTEPVWLSPVTNWHRPFASTRN